MKTFYQRNRNKNTSLKRDCLRDALNNHTNTPDAVLKVTFRDDYDITALHSKVLMKISKDQTRSRDIQEKINKLELYKTTCNSKLKIIQINAEIDDLNLEYKTSSDETRLEQYTKEVETFLEQYKSLKRLQGYSKIREKYNATEEDLERIKCITGFLEIVKKYYPIEYRCVGYLKEVPWHICENCGTDLISYTAERNGFVLCPICSTHKIMGKCRTKMVDDVDFVDNTRKPANENKTNITKALLQFQGKILPSFDHEKMAQDLDDYFQSIGMPSREEISEMPRTPDGRKKGTCCEIVRNAMTEKKYNKYYDFARFMCCYMWGWKLTDLSSIEDEILYDDRRLEEGYAAIPMAIKNRSSSIPIQIRLYFHLKNRGVSCVRDDFKLPKEISKYNSLLRLSCENSGMRYIPI